MRSGYDALPMLVQLSSHVVPMEADTCAVGEGSTCTAEPSHWKNVVDEYIDVFEPPAMPAERDTVHCIEVEPGSEPLYRWQYCVSAAELMEVRW